MATGGCGDRVCSNCETCFTVCSSRHWRQENWSAFRRCTGDDVAGVCRVPFSGFISCLRSRNIASLAAAALTAHVQVCRRKSVLQWSRYAVVSQCLVFICATLHRYKDNVICGKFTVSNASIAFVPRTIHHAVRHSVV